MPRFLAIAGLTLAAACASAPKGATSSAPPVTMTPTTARVTTGTGNTININTVTVNTGRNTLVLASMDSAWNALKAVYGELGIPVTTLNDAQHMIGNDGYKVRRRVGKIAMQNVLDCGGSQGMPNAETYDIWLVISSYLEKNPKAGQNLITRIDATGKSPSFNRDQNVTCSSQGELEKAIGEAVRKKVGN